MPRTAKKPISRCDQHNFVLRPRQDTCYYSQAFAASFCLRQNQKGKTKKNKIQKRQCLDCPTFNRDNNFATPTFILNSQKDYYQEKGIKLKEEHQKKMFQYSDQKSELLIPKPRSKNSFCSVCRQNYQDYRDHIQSTRHKEKINRSLFNSYILEITDKFSHLNINKSIEAFSCQGPQASTTYDDEIQIYEQYPRKKVKCEENYNNKNFPLQPPSFYQNGFIPPPPHLTNYNYDAFSFPYQGYGINNHNYPSMAHSSLMPNQSIGPQQNGFGQFPTYGNQPPQSNNVYYNYQMNIYLHPFSFPMMHQNSFPSYSSFMDPQRFYHQNCNQGTLDNNRVPIQNIGPVNNSGTIGRSSKPLLIDLQEQNAVIN